MRTRASKLSWKNVNLFGAIADMNKPAKQTLRLGGILLLSSCFAFSAFAQSKPNKTGSHSTRVRATMSAEAKALLEQAMAVVCTQAKLDPKSSVAIDEMQARPSLPVQSPEARAGAERAQRLLPLAKELVVTSLRQLATEYKLQNSRNFNLRLQRAIARVNSVRRVRP